MSIIVRGHDLTVACSTDGIHFLILCSFKQLCEDAFLLLRRHGDLFINLFAMMLSTGIPELRTAEDVDYVREALCLGRTEEFAKRSFHSKFQEAIRNNKTVAINWWMHNIAKQQN